MITLNGEKILDDVVKAYRDACAKHGQRKQLGEDVIWAPGSILPTPGRSQAACRAVARRAVQVVRAVRLRALRRRARAHVGTPGAPARVPNLTDGIAQKAWFCGRPRT